MTADSDYPTGLESHSPVSSMPALELDVSTILSVLAIPPVNDHKVGQPKEKCLFD